MNLILIKEKQCPHCGAHVVTESCRRYHCNGQGFEEREFACGLKLVWVPNFSRQEVEKQCRQHPDHIEAVRKQAKAEQALRDCINAQDVNGEWKRRMLIYVG